jgi:hypothetical protein
MIPIVLKVYDGGKLISSRVFTEERVRMGCSEADLLLAGPGVDAEHAVIEAKAGGVVLRATGESPLYLNGQPIIAAPLRHGDLISIGDLRILVEIGEEALEGPIAVATPSRRSPHLHIVHGGEDDSGVRPALSVVRDPKNSPEVKALADALPTSGSIAAFSIAPQVVVTPVARPLAQPPPPYAVLPRPVVQGGECAEVELFWGDTRVSVWQLAPGEEFSAGSAAGCQALLQGIDRAQVLKSDATGWTVNAPRPLQLFLEEDGRVLGGSELLVRGRSTADAQGLVVPLPQLAVAVLTSGNLALRIRRVRSSQRVGGEQTDLRGVLGATAAAVLMMVGLRYWSATVPPRSSGNAELISPRPLVVRSTVKPNDAKVVHEPKNEGRRDPGVAAARHSGEEGQAGSKNAPRRDARAQRKMDDRALVASSGLLKALGGGAGQSTSFGVALEKGTVDAMGHLTGPRVADAHGDAGMGLKSLGGRGGGGDGSGLGLARIGTNGIGGGLANYGDGKGGLRGKEDGDIGLGPEKPEVVGSIDPELIRKVVHDHRAQIRTCYETQLTSKPSLAGKIIAAWTIDQSGTVTESKTQETTMHDHNVEDCVASKIKTWRFPIPKGGGEVFVTYPFIFTPGG